MSNASKSAVTVRQNEDLTEAVAAVCALMASADEVVKPCERDSISAALSTDDAFADLDVGTVEDLMSDFIDLLRDQGVDAKPKLSQRIMLYYGDERRSHALIHLAHRIMVADHATDEAEAKEFQRLCRILDVDPEFLRYAK